MEVFGLIAFVLVIIMFFSHGRAINDLYQKNLALKKELKVVYRILDKILAKHKKKLGKLDAKVSTSESKVVISGGELDVKEDSQGDRELIVSEQSKKALLLEENQYTTSTHDNTPDDGNEPGRLDQLRQWFLNDWPLKLGAGLLIIGMTWFVTYAFSHNWIAPSIRIILGCLLGIAFIYFGRSRNNDEVEKSSILIGLGSAIYLLSLVAARYYFDLISPLVSLLLMSVVVVAVGLISVAKEYQPLAIVALLFGSVVPFLTLLGYTDPTMILIYYFVLSLGAVVVSWSQGRKILYGISVLLFALYSFTAYLLVGGGGLNQTDLYIAFSFGIVFLVTNVLQILEDKDTTLFGFTGSVINAGTIVLWLLVFTNVSEYSIYLFLIALICFGISIYFYQKLKGNNSIIQYALFGIIFLALGLFSVLDGELLMLSYILLSGLFIIGAMQINKSTKYLKYVQWTFILPLVQAIWYGVNQVTGGLEALSSPLLVWGVFFIVTGMIAWFAYSYQKNDEGTLDNGKLWQSLSVCSGFMIIYTLVGIEYFVQTSMIVVFLASLFLHMNGKNILAKNLMIWYIIPVAVLLFHLREGWSDMGLLVSFIVLIVSSIFYEMKLRVESQSEDISFSNILLHGGIVVGGIVIIQTMGESLWSLLSICLSVIVFVIFFLLTQKKKSSIFWWLVPGVLYSIPSIILSSDWSSGIMHNAGISLLGILLAFYGAWVFLSAETKEEETKASIVEYETLKLWIKSTGGVYLFISVWLVTHGLMDNGVANLISLAIYTVFGLRQYLQGKEKNNNISLWIGSIILISVCLHLVLVDMSQMEIVWRIVTFILIGAMFIVSGFISKKKE